MDLEAYHRFIRECSRNIARIARKTCGECSAQDVVNELCVTALELKDRKSIEIDFDSPEHRDWLLAYTYQRLVKFTETTTRYATSLDAPWLDDIDNLYNKVADTEADISEILEDEESSVSEQRLLKQQGMTLSCAWLLMLEQYANDMKRVARFLKLSRSHSYRRLNEVAFLEQAQYSLPLSPGGCEEQPIRPWRKYWYCRPPEQLDLLLEIGFDF